ncbi:MAG TPA: alpha/beta hydrolase [Gemmatimonadaceae bacterium]
MLRLGVALIVFLASLLTVVRAPTYNAWKLSVAVTEWGHVVALLALLAFLPGWRSTATGKLAAALGGAAVVLALTPLARAIPIASSLPDDMNSAFGPSSPRTMPGANARPKPLAFLDVLTHVKSPSVRVDTATYVMHDETSYGTTLYRPLTTSTPLPVVIMIHGGSWSGGTRNDLPGLNRYLAARGYAVATISYRFAPLYPHPAASQDVHAAIEFLKTNAGRLELDASRIALIGRSAGGQLALLAAYTEHDSAIKGVVGFYAPSDQLFGYEHPTNPRVLNSTTTLEEFLAGSPKTAPEAYMSSSPINFIGPSTVPTLLIHGAQDELVYAEQSERLDARLALARRPHFFLRLPWGVHGCDYNFSGPCGQLSTYAIERFLAAVLR